MYGTITAHTTFRRLRGGEWVKPVLAMIKEER